MDQPTEQQQIRMSRAYEAVVVAVGGLVGASSGLVANLVYARWRSFGELATGPVIGCVAGLAAGYLWVRAMRRNFGAGPGYWRLAGWGVLFGTLVGSGATVLLFLALMVWFGERNPEILVGSILVAHVGGLPAGAITGVICALSGAVTTARIRRKAAAIAEQTHGA